MIPMDIYGIIAAASNIRSEDHPSYTADDFKTMYPQFGEVPDVVLQAWLNVALATLQYGRWKGYWTLGVGLFIAHFLTLYLQTMTPAGVSTAKILESGLAKGVVSSKSAGDLSKSYDFGAIASEFDGWGTYKQTVFGQQLVHFARLVGKGGMTVW
jgi:hypothetical protein